MRNPHVEVRRAQAANPECAERGDQFRRAAKLHGVCDFTRAAALAPLAPGGAPGAGGGGGKTRFGLAIPSPPAGK